MQEMLRHPDRYEDWFPDWLKENWPLWTAFCRIARAAQDNGRKHYSARGIFHAIRFHTSIRDAVPMLRGIRVEEGFKVNNDKSALMARLFNNMHPDNEGFFKTREHLR